MKTLEEIRNTPVLLLTPEEIAQLSPESQEWANRCQAQEAREVACPSHEAISESTWEEQRRGWHLAKCKHCGKDMSVDSGD
jgi:hypothetical protein